MLPAERISRFLSFLLRHRPRDYPLNFDDGGFVPLEELLETVRSRFPNAAETEVLSILEESEKMRFEFTEGRVRATYGHSFPVNFDQKRLSPPRSLYYGTARDLAENLLEHGLHPRGRQYVHLSSTLDDALNVGKRSDPRPAVITIRARDAEAEGIVFYQSGPLYMADEIPARFLSLWAPE